MLKSLQKQNIEHIYHDIVGQYFFAAYMDYCDFGQKKSVKK